MTPTQKTLQEKFSALEPKFDFILAPLTYMKIGGPAEVFFEFKKRTDIIEVVQFCHNQNIPLTVLGGASNIIISDAGLKDVVIILSNEEYELGEKLADGRTLVRCGAGSRTGPFVRKTVENGLRGLEYFLGVPGKIGGAIYNNAHYLSDLIGKHIHRVEVITEKNEVIWMSHDECQFAYDYSIFHETKDVILQLEFALAPGEKSESLQLIKEATMYRSQSQPLGDPSSGCYFRNSPNTPELKDRFPQFADRREIPSAYLIDQAGLKGTKVGGVEVSQKHAAFFINTGGGSSSEVKQLAEIVKQRVSEQYGVKLQPEVFFLGE